MAGNNKKNLLSEYRHRLSELNRELMVAMGDLNECEKTISRLRNEAFELKKNIDNNCNGGSGAV